MRLGFCVLKKMRSIFFDTHWNGTSAYNPRHLSRFHAAHGNVNPRVYSVFVKFSDIELFRACLKKARRPYSGSFSFGRRQKSQKYTKYT